jgi:hypothetical protein
MRKVKRPLPHVRLERIVEALEQELIAASDAELLQAASDLGMKPGMRGSAAFLGLLYPAKSRLQDFFAAGVRTETWAAIERLRQLRRQRVTEEAPATEPLRTPGPRKEPDEDE